MEGRPEILALGQDRAPAQSGLKTFQTQFFEQPPIITHRTTPFMVVIIQKFRRGAAPAAPRLTVRTNDSFAHELLRTMQADEVAFRVFEEPNETVLADGEFGFHHRAAGLGNALKHTIKVS